MSKNPNKIRVCFVAVKAYPIFNPAVEKVFGGAEVDLYLLATELAKDGRFDVRFVVGDYGQLDGEVREGVTLYKSIKTDRFMLLEGAKVWQALKRADADVYMHEACSLGTTLIAAFCKWHRRKFVYRTASSGEADGSCFAKNPVLGYLIRCAFVAADVFITQNQQDADNAAKTIKRDTKVIRNACRLSPYQTSSKDSILWAGRSHAIKRPELFLDLAKAFPHHSFVMICQEGTGDADYAALVNQAKKIDNLTFVHRMPFHNIVRYFEQAKMLVNTSDSEGFPNTFLQAAAAGAAILSYKVNPDDFLTRYSCGLGCGGDMNQLKQGLVFLLENNRYQKQGANGLRYCQQTHDVHQIIETYKELFIRILESQ